MNDVIGGIVVLVVVVGFFGLIGLAIWSDQSMRGACLDKGGTIANGMCVRVQPLAP